MGNSTSIPIRPMAIFLKFSLLQNSWKKFETLKANIQCQEQQCKESKWNYLDRALNKRQRMSTEWIFICSHYNKLGKDSDPWHRRNLPSFDIFNKIIPKRAGKNTLSLFLSIKRDPICIMKKNTNNSIVFRSSFYKAFAWDLILPWKSIRFSQLCWRRKCAALNVSSYLVPSTTHRSAKRTLKVTCSILAQPTRATAEGIWRGPNFNNLV